MRKLLFCMLLTPATLFAQDAPATPTGESVPVGDNGAEELEELHRSALDELATSLNRADILQALTTLREGFPASRALLAQAVRGGPPRVRAHAVRILGELGTVEDDYETVVLALHDPHAPARLAAVMASRKLGSAGFDAMVKLIKREKKRNIRKMAVKTLQEWGDRRAVFELARFLKNEKDNGVRNFIYNALEGLTKKKLERSVAAWDAYVSREIELEQLRGILDHRKTTES